VPEFTVTGVVPDEVSVNVRVAGVFNATLPKRRLVALTVNRGFAAVPVPLRATTAVLPVVELLLIVSCPVIAPAVVGLNCTCTVNDCVGFKVTGKRWATMVKPAPAIVAAFTVNAEVPVDVRVMDAVAAEFVATLPKLRLAALTVNWELDAVVPVPLRATTLVLPVDELLLIVICPVIAPVVIGSNWTCRVIDCVGFNVAGKVPPTRV
jgi:hypothetical protein